MKCSLKDNGDSRCQGAEGPSSQRCEDLQGAWHTGQEASASFYYCRAELEKAGFRLHQRRKEKGGDRAEKLGFGCSKGWAKEEEVEKKEKEETAASTQ